MDDKQLEQYGIELARAAFNARGQLVQTLATQPHLKSVQSYEQLPGAAQAGFRIMALAVAKKVGEMGMVPPPRRSAPHQESAPRVQNPAMKPPQLADFESPSLAKTTPPIPPAPSKIGASEVMAKLQEVLGVAVRVADALTKLEERVRVLEGVNQVVHPEVVPLKPGPEGDGAPTGTDFAG